MQEDDYDQRKENMQFKYILIGDVGNVYYLLILLGVGKSSLLKQFVEKRFLEDYHITIGVEFDCKIIEINRTLIKLQIWDTTGQESFKSVTRLYYRAAAGAIMVFDLTRRETFENILSWYEEAKTNGNPNMKFLLVGNKNDMEDQRTVQFQEAQQLAETNNFEYIEASAQNGFNVEDAFLNLSYRIYQNVIHDSDLVHQKYGIKLLIPFKDLQLEEQTQINKSKEGQDQAQNKNKTKREYQNNQPQTDLNISALSSVRGSQRIIVKSERLSKRQAPKSRTNAQSNEKDYHEYFENNNQSKQLKPTKSGDEQYQKCQCCADQ